MAIKPLSVEEIKKMTIACRIAADTLTYLDKYVKPGVSTLELDELANDYMLTKGAKSACIGYNGYPRYTCISVNEVICHGLPNATTILKDGDITNIDVTAFIDGFYGDTSKMYAVGTISEVAQDLIDVAYQARDIGIKSITPNGYTGDIGFETNKLVTRRGYTVIKEIGGHGVGRKFHEEPFVPAWGKKGKGERLVPFHCITVEPMINQGTDEYIEFDIANSNIKYYNTADGMLSAQFEHTVLVTDTGYEILTLP